MCFYFYTVLELALKGGGGTYGVISPLKLELPLGNGIYKICIYYFWLYLRAAKFCRNRSQTIRGSPLSARSQK